MPIHDIEPPRQGGVKKEHTFVVAEKDAEKKHRRVREVATAILGACFILFVITAFHLRERGLTLKHSLVATIASGFGTMINATSEAEDGRFEKSKKLFEDAKKIFVEIESETWFTDAADAIVETGRGIAQAGERFSGIASRLSFLPQSIFQGNSKTFGTRLNSTAATPRPSLTEALKAELPEIAAAIQDIQHADGAADRIPESFVPESLRDEFRFGREALQTLSHQVENLQNDLPVMLKLLGDTEPHTFLILLQNNAELRPTGGFIGNYMIAETNDGYLTKHQVFDVYGSDHELAEVIPPPSEIAAINPRWYLRDSNYSAHFPLSAEKAAWFLEKSKGPGVDTILAIDQTFVADLLRSTGSVKLPELAKPLTGDNFATVLSYIIEAKLSGKQQPKAILSSFLDATSQHLFANIDPVTLLPLLRSAVDQKHVLGYSRDPEVQKFFQHHGMSGELKTLDPKEDFLGIVHTSIGGNKSDAYMKTTIAHDTYLKKDGSVIDELRLTRHLLWPAGEEKRLQNLVASFGLPPISERLMQILGRSRNLHRLRIYVPSGATLESSSDSSVRTNYDPETDKTYFSAEMNVGVAESKTITIRYRLPFALNLSPVDKYAFTIQKHAGQNEVQLNKRIFADSGISSYSSFPKEGIFDIDGVWNFTSDLIADMSFVSVWGK